jgi:F5/8 type C domain
MSITIRSAQTIRNGVTLRGAIQPSLGVSRSYRYWKFSVTRIADASAENNEIWQISELVLKLNGQRIDYTGATASSPGASYSGGESPPNAIDNDPTTKFCVVANNGMSGLGWPLIIDFGQTVTADSMTYFTANDSGNRDPVDWILWGGNDGTNWDPVFWTTGYTPPTDREVETAKFYFNPTFANHVTVPTVTGGISGTNVYQAWTTPNDNNDASIPVGATAFGTNLNNHIGGIYTVTENILDGGFQKITVQDGINSTIFNVTNVGSNEPFEVYWN